MRLTHFISLRLSVIAAAVLAFWSVFFYFAIIDEINDEVDDSLENYAELIIMRSLAGEPLPTETSGSNNQYYLRDVSPEYAATHPHVRYEDRTVYIKEKREYEPARVISYIFRTDEGGFREVEVSVPSIEKTDLIEAIFYWLLFLYIAILLGFVLLNRIALKRCMRPLDILLKWLDDYRLGGTNLELNNPTSVTEFRKLNDSVTRLMTRSEQQYEQQKLFIGNASHEMQTPLAICQNRIEMLLDDERLNEEQMGELLKVRNTLGALSKLNKSLLLLCKIENGQFSDVEPVDMDAVAEELMEEYKEVYASRKIEVSVSRKAHWHLNMNAMLASVLVGNLLKNAFVHNREGGRIVLTTEEHGLRVANTGVQEPLEEDKIFTRFYHTQGKKSSSGIGLSLVSAICASCGIKVTYKYEDGLHVFTLFSHS